MLFHLKDYHEKIDPLYFEFSFYPDVCSPTLASEMEIRAMMFTSAYHIPPEAVAGSIPRVRPGFETENSHFDPGSVRQLAIA